jgi:hypothetical protein
MNTLEIYTKKYGVVELREDELALLTNAHLKMLGMTRLELHRCFAKGVSLMKERNVKPGDRIRPCADFAGRWGGDLVHRSVIR